MDFRVLGPLEVLEGERVLPLGGPARRAVVAMLLLDANRVVSTDRLIDGLWGDDQPSAPKRSLQSHVWRLRSVLGERLQTRSPGYLLRVEPGELDLDRFHRLVDEAGAAEPAVAATKLREALQLWRGPALAELRDQPVGATADRLDELRLGALEQCLGAELSLGQHQDLVPELEALVHEQPFRERLRELLILALYRSGRQADALEAFSEGRRMFVEELGSEPGPELQELHRAVLRHDPQLGIPDASPRPPKPTAPAHEARKTVTVLVAGLVGSGDVLDPESRRRLIEARWQEAALPVERWGGMAERLGGDRLLGVFGAPTTRDDDGLRAVRAAFELQEGPGVAVGLATGEVITGGSGEPLVSGSAVEEATRLCGLAANGQVVAAERTWRLVRHAVSAQPVDGGRRLESIDLTAPPLPRRFDTPFVGRRHELAAVDAALESAKREGRVRLLTVYGPPGIGKTRLAMEAIAQLGDAATCLVGHFLPGGEDATYAPLRELVTAAWGDTPDAALRDVLRDDPQSDLVAARVAAAVGAAREPGSVTEIAWAVRRLFQAVARERPLVVVLEDAHWAAPAFLDLVDHLVDLGQAPIVVLVLARPELLELRPGWGGGKVSSSSLLLDALSTEESEALLAQIAPPRAIHRSRILTAAEGNPLFLEQLLAAELDGEGGRMPDSIHGLLAARLDRLDTTERGIAETAAVCGQTFAMPAVEELARREPHSALEALARRQLVEPARDSPAGEEQWAFKHGLIWEAVYEAVPKRRRAIVHESAARRLLRQGAERGIVDDEATGTHLERAVLYRRELGEEGAAVRRLGAEAAGLLGTAGERAYERNDMVAAASLLERAARLLPAESEQHARVGVRLGSALGWTGDRPAGLRVFADARATAERLGKAALVARIQVAEQSIALFSGGTPAGRLLEAIDWTIPVLEAARDEEGLAEAQVARAHGIWRSGGDADGRVALDLALAHARRAGSTYLEGMIDGWRLAGITHSPLSVGEAAAECQEVLEASPTLVARAAALGGLGLIAAMEGRFDDGRALVQENLEILDELALRPTAAAHSIARAEVEIMAGDLGRAEEILRVGYDELEAVGDRFSQSIVACLLAGVLCDKGRDDEAERMTHVAERTPTVTMFDVGWRLVRATVAARRGFAEDARDLLREALELARTLPDSPWQADAFIRASETYQLVGRSDVAVRLLRDAAGIARRKGYTVAGDRAARMLSER